MRLILDPSWGGLGARLAGTYEEEEAQYIIELLTSEPALVLDIGAAEGYYAVGIARRMPSTPVISFDIDPKARRVCRRNAELNGVSNLKVRGRATPAALQRCLRPRSLVICDCECYEEVLMDLRSVPTLRSCSILVELHEFLVPGVTDLVIKRFRDTHSVSLADAEPRTSFQRPQLSHLNQDELLHVIDEGRPWEPAMQWAILRPIEDPHCNQLS